MTAAELVQALTAYGVTLTPNLSVESAKAPPAELVAELKDRKNEVIAHLLALDPNPCAIDDAEVAMFRTRNRPRGSWLIGLGLLARRLAHAIDPTVRARLEHLLLFTPLTKNDFEDFERRVNDVLADLEAEGKLPPV